MTLRLLSLGLLALTACATPTSTGQKALYIGMQSTEVAGVTGLAVYGLSCAWKTSDDCKPWFGLLAGAAAGAANGLTLGYGVHQEATAVDWGLVITPYAITLVSVLYYTLFARDGDAHSTRASAAPKPAPPRTAWRARFVSLEQARMFVSAIMPERFSECVVAAARLSELSAQARQENTPLVLERSNPDPSLGACVPTDDRGSVIVSFWTEP
jgi:hypothetical protein